MRILHIRSITSNYLIQYYFSIILVPPSRMPTGPVQELLGLISTTLAFTFMFSTFLCLWEQLCDFFSLIFHFAHCFLSMFILFCSFIPLLSFKIFNNYILISNIPNSFLKIISSYNCMFLHHLDNLKKT